LNLLRNPQFPGIPPAAHFAIHAILPLFACIHQIAMLGRGGGDFLEQLQVLKKIGTNGIRQIGVVQ
jgi:hypothetical protein